MRWRRAARLGEVRGGRGGSFHSGKRMDGVCFLCVCAVCVCMLVWFGFVLVLVVGVGRVSLLSVCFCCRYCVDFQKKHLVCVYCGFACRCPWLCCCLFCRSSCSSPFSLLLLFLPLAWATRPNFVFLVLNPFYEKLRIRFRYLNQQIVPPVSRLCEPIEGTSMAILAEKMGLDASKFALSVSGELRWGGFNGGGGGESTWCQPLHCDAMRVCRLRCRTFEMPLSALVGLVNLPQAYVLVPCCCFSQSSLPVLLRHFVFVFVWPGVGVKVRLCQVTSRHITS